MQIGSSLSDTYNINLVTPSFMSLPIPQIFSDHYLPSKCFAFDIAVNTSATNDKGFCPYYLPVINYLNQEWTQKALGVPLNFTYISELVLRSYTLSQGGEPPNGTGDA